MPDIFGPRVGHSPTYKTRPQLSRNGPLGYTACRVYSPYPPEIGKPRCWTIDWRIHGMALKISGRARLVLPSRCAAAKTK